MDGYSGSPQSPAVHVLATTLDGTRAALSAAVPLASGSHAPLVVVVPQIVPFPLRIDRPVDSSDVLLRRYRELLDGWNVDVHLRLCVCRRAEDVLTRLLPRGATVVIGGPPAGLLPRAETWLIRRMNRLGHHVVFVATASGRRRR